MRLLSVEEMRRIVDSRETFLLVDVRPVEVTLAGSLPQALRVPHGCELLRKVLAVSGRRELTIVVTGGSAADPVAAEAAEQLRRAGFLDVWTYGSDPDPWQHHETQLADQPVYASSDSAAYLSC